MTKRGAEAAEVVQVLTAARQTISSPDNWTKEKFFYPGVHAERLYDPSISDEEHYMASTQFCALGAIRRNNRHVGQTHEAAERALAKASPVDCDYTQERVYIYNDHEDTKHEDVLAMFDLAIEQQCKIVREEAEKDDSHLPDQD